MSTRWLIYCQSLPELALCLTASQGIIKPGVDNACYSKQQTLLWRAPLVTNDGLREDKRDMRRRFDEAQKKEQNRGAARHNTEPSEALAHANLIGGSLVGAAAADYRDSTLVTRRYILSPTHMGEH